MAENLGQGGNDLLIYTMSLKLSFTIGGYMNRHITATLIVLAAFATTVQLSSCGGGSSATPTPTPTVPTISSVTGITTATTTSATIAATGTTGISVLATNPLTITFSTAMDTATITTSNISLSCGGTAQTITIANTNSPTNTIFTVTPSANTAQVTSCTLTIGTGVESADAGALAAAATYAYTTGCATSDDFTNSTTLTDCWTEQASSAGTTAMSSNALTLTTTAAVNAGQGPAVSKAFASSDTSITQTVKLTVTNLIENQDMCNVALFQGTSNGAIMGIGWDEPLGQISLFANGGGTETTHVPVTVDGNNSATVYLRLSYSGNIVTPSYSSAGTTYTALSNTFSFVPTGNILSFLEAEHGATTHTATCKYENFTITGATAIGQD